MHVEAGEWVEDSQDRPQGWEEWDYEMSPAECRAYVLSYMLPELHCGDWPTMEDIERQTGETLCVNGHPISTCHTDAERAGWLEEKDFEARYTAPDRYDAEAIEFAGQAARDAQDSAYRDRFVVRSY